MLVLNYRRKENDIELKVCFWDNNWYFVYIKQSYHPT